MTILQYQHNSRSYSFHGTLLRAGAEPVAVGKNIYRGCFPEECPPNLEKGREYMLLEIRVAEGDPANPQDREFWDIAPFHGAHLREILSRNDDAQRMLSRLRPGQVPDAGVYMAIEPVYAPLSLSTMERMTVYERLVLLRQIAGALVELYSQSVDGHFVIAHRDLKLGNVLIQPGAEEFTARLIDFASVCFDSGSGTLRSGGLSRSNAAWELFAGDGMEKITKKLDVFVLGGILGELLGDKNPIYEWVGETWQTNAMFGPASSLNAEMEERFREVRERFTGEQAGLWLEETLQRRFSWREDLPGALAEQVQRLFRQMIPVEPEARIPIEDVVAALEEMIAMCEGNPAWARRSGDETLYVPVVNPAACYILMDTRHMIADAVRYELALRRCWGSGCRRALQKGFTGLDAHTFFFSSARRDEKEFISKGGFYACYPDCDGLLAGLREKAPGGDEGYSLLVPVLYGILRKGAPENFNGEIHVFLPDDFLPHMTRGGMGLEALCAKLRERLNARIICHGPASLLDQKWFDRLELLEERSQQASAMAEPPEKEGGSYAAPSGIGSDRGGWFILSGEKKIYVGRRL